MSYEPTTSSCSNTTQSQKAFDDDNFEFNIRNDKAELDMLETVEAAGKADCAPDDDDIAKIKFKCYCCGMEEMVHYFGAKPSFVFGVEFNEPTYVMRDPFQARPPKWKPKPEYFVALGAHCKLCEKVVCKDNECSFFYINSYCINCVKKIANTFPLDIQQKLRKQLELNTN